MVRPCLVAMICRQRSCYRAPRTEGVAEVDRVIKEWTGQSTSSLLRIAEDGRRWTIITAEVSVGVPQRRLGVTDVDWLIDWLNWFFSYRPQTLCVITRFCCLSAIWFFFRPPDVSCILLSIYKRHLSCKEQEYLLPAVWSRDAGTTQGFNWVHIFGCLCHSRHIIILQVLWLVLISVFVLFLCVSVTQALHHFRPFLAVIFPRHQFLLQDRWCREQIQKSLLIVRK